MSSWSARRSNSLQEASSEPVAKAFPFGKNYTQGCKNLNTGWISKCKNVQNQFYTYADGVNVRNMASEGLPAHAISNVPKLGGGITGTRNEGPGVRAERQTHHITGVAREGGGLLACFDVPQCTGEQEFSNQLCLWKIYIHFISNVEQHWIGFKICLKCTQSTSSPLTTWCLRSWWQSGCHWWNDSKTNILQGKADKY